MSEIHYLRAMVESLDEQRSAIDRQKRSVLALIDEVEQRDGASAGPVERNIKTMKDAQSYMTETYGWATYKVQRLRFEGKCPEAFIQHKGEKRVFVDIDKLVTAFFGSGDQAVAS